MDLDQWIFEGDIKSFFDQVSFNWLENNVVMDKLILKKFLQAGYVEKDTLEATTKGVPQGGTISPALALITLSGLEEKLAKQFKRNRGKVNLVTYADDFIVTAESKEVLEKEVVPLVAYFLKERGLQLSKEKSRITHISQGFDFLGFNIRKYGRSQKCLIKPSKASIKSFLLDIKRTITTNFGAKTEYLILLLNPKITGWTNYYRHSTASETFAKIDSRIYRMLNMWSKKRHYNKGFRWIYQKYFQRLNSRRRWHFHAKTMDNKTSLFGLKISRRHKN